MRLFIAGMTILFVTSFLRGNEPIFKPTGIYAEKPTADHASSPTKSRAYYHSYRPWYLEGRDTPDSHLIRDHGVSPAELAGLTRDEKNRLHGKMHGERPMTSTTTTHITKPQTRAGCPGGVCPAQISSARRRR